MIKAVSEMIHSQIDRLKRRYEALEKSEKQLGKKDSAPELIVIPKLYLPKNVIVPKR